MSTLSNLDYSSLSQDWKINGDKSFYIDFGENPDSSYKLVDLFRLLSDTYESGNYTVQVDIYKVSGSFSIVFFNQTNISRIDNIPNGESILSLSGDVINKNYLSLRVLTSSTAKVYFDNISLIKNNQ